MNKEPDTPHSETVEESEPEHVHVELTEVECSIIQHVLVQARHWNYEEGDDALGNRHNEIRNKLIDGHEEYLEAQEGGSL